MSMEGNYTTLRLATGVDWSVKLALADDPRVTEPCRVTLEQVIGEGLPNRVTERDYQYKHQALQYFYAVVDRQVERRMEALHRTGIKNPCWAAVVYTSENTN